MGDSEFQPPHQQHAEAISPETTPGGENPIIPHEQRETHTFRPDQPSKMKQIFEGLAITAAVFASVVYFLQLTALVDSNQISRQSLQSVQRAFMNFDNITVHILAVGEKENTEPAGIFGAKFENVGTTPANNVIPFLGIERLPSEPDGTKFIGKNAEPLHTYVGPKGPLTVGPKFMKFSETGLSRPDATIHADLYIWGWVAYDDVFPGTARHLTEFCQQVTNLDLKSTGNGSFFTTNCKKHNCEDQWCPDYTYIISANR
jgi:hypothetical protein